MGGGEDAVLLLTGFTRGITHSASVARGDEVCFRPTQRRSVSFWVEHITHEWEAPGSPKAPVSWAEGYFSHQLYEDEYQGLLKLGFKEE